MTDSFKSGNVTFHFINNNNTADATEFANFVEATKILLSSSTANSALSTTLVGSSAALDINVYYGDVALTPGISGGETIFTSDPISGLIVGAEIHINASANPNDTTSIRNTYSQGYNGAPPVSDNAITGFANEFGDVVSQYNPNIHISRPGYVGSLGDPDYTNNLIGHLKDTGVTPEENNYSIDMENWARGLLGLPPRSHNESQVPTPSGGGGNDPMPAGTIEKLQGGVGDEARHLGDDIFGASGEASPLILDISGNGLALSSLSESATRWDIDADGFREISAWTKEGTGLLCIDLNNDGKINDNDELFGNRPADNIPNGFSALAAYDSNSDGVIDSSDAQFAQLKVWVDDDNDGFSQSSELHSLSDLNITSISLSYTDVNYQLSGNTLKQEGTFVIDGQTRTIADAWLSYDNLHSTFDGNFELDMRTIYMPQQRGYGALPDLYIAMSMDSDLLDMVDDLSSKTARELFSESYDIRATLQAIMYEWAGVTDHDPNGHQYHGDDGRRLEFMEKFADISMYGISFESGQNAPWVYNAWNEAVNFVGKHLLLQAGLGELFGNPVYNFATDTFSGGEFGDTPTMFRFVPMQHFFVDTIISDSGENDIYIVTPGGSETGNYVIVEPTDQGNDTLLIGGVDPTDVKLWTDGDGKLVVHYTDDDTITILGDLESNGATDVNHRVERILFDNGTTIDMTEGLWLVGDDTGRTIRGSNQNDMIQAGSGDDSLRGYDGADTLAGGDGANYLEGGTGNDTYLFAASSGSASTHVYEATGEGVDTVQVDANVADVRFWVDAYGSGHLVLTSDSDNELIITANADSSGTDLANRIEKISFNDAAWDFTSGLIETDTEAGHYLYGGTLNDTLDGRGGDDNINGYGGNDTLNGGEGNDYLYGGTGDDTYLFAASAGSATTHVWESAGEGTDTIQIAGNPDDLRMWTDSFGMAHIVFAADSDNELIISGNIDSTGSDLTNRIEHIVFSDSTDWNLSNGLIETDTDAGHYLYGGALGDTLDGRGGDDNISAYGGNDTLNGGEGNDYLYGGTGDDTYVFVASAGSATTHVYESTGEGTDTIQIAGNPDDIRMWLDDWGVAHIVFAADSDNEMLIQTDVSSGTNLASRIEHISFSDSTDWNLASGLIEKDTDTGHTLQGASTNDTLDGQGGNDYIYGYGGDDTLIGGAGSDGLFGGDGNDTFVFKAATALSGVDTIYDFSTAHDTIDIRDVLSNYNPATDNLSDFVQITDAYDSGHLSVDMDGTGTAYSMTEIATIINVTGLDAATMVAAGQLLIAA